MATNIPDDISSEEFNLRMASDKDFRDEMARRQKAALEKMEKRKEAYIKELERRHDEKTSESQIIFSEDFESLNACSDRFIKLSPIHTLRDAVKENKLSKTRFRMELKRRQKKDYFEGMPDNPYQFNKFG